MAINNLYISYYSFFEENNWNVEGCQLLTNKNCKSIIDSNELIDCYTEFTELTCNNLYSICDNALAIELYDIDRFFFSIKDPWIYFILFKKLNEPNIKVKLNEPPEPICNKFFEATKNLYSNVDRTGISNVYWAAGCSYTEGVGIDINERYSHLISKKLNIPEINLARGGSSIFFSADQILQANISKNDIVIWGLTSSSRFDYFDHDLTHVSKATVEYFSIPEEFKYHDIDYFTSNTFVSINLKYIHQVVNFCDKIGAKLILVNFLNLPFSTILKDQYPGKFLDLYKDYDDELNQFKYIDFGTDNQHPGPMQHKDYAEKIYLFIKENYPI